MRFYTVNAYKGVKITTGFPVVYGDWLPIPRFIVPLAQGHFFEVSDVYGFRFQYDLGNGARIVLDENTQLFIDRGELVSVPSKHALMVQPTQSNTNDALVLVEYASNVEEEPHKKTTNVYLVRNGDHLTITPFKTKAERLAVINNGGRLIISGTVPQREEKKYSMVVRTFRQRQRKYATPPPTEVAAD
ncbi:MAG: hypothetical protein KatS3mg054_0440 [Chloroflexus sp.]|nr:MAG: hypothetical protein KatS3mg054_0205 [Chloroflexus sp.]GIV86411.1 MAG: hypothetical protein KatS3mg054_0440 [Chloroflexus sp.]